MEVKLFRPTTRNTQLIGVKLISGYPDDWLKLYFSYRTIVAFKESGEPLFVVQNVWSSTTGRHLNEIDDGAKEDRLNYNDFQQQLNAALERFLNG